MVAIETSADYLDIMEKYTEYTGHTLDGKHGNTAKFWMIYVKLVHTFLQFSRACRMNDLELFIYVLGEMCPIFFAAHRPNYSRWMVRYHLNLMNIDQTHPGLKDTLQNGALSIRRTNKTFARTPVDMALEQTINADAASRLTGIAAFSSSDSARRRWMVTRSVRSAIVGHLLSKAGLHTTEDITKTLKPHRIAKDNEDLQKVTDGIQNTMNPFTDASDDNLYCLTTGKKIADDIKDDLLNAREKGRAWYDEFVTGCFKNPSHFEKPIPRRKVKNFASAALKVKVSTKDLKLIELQGTRDLFGRLLYMSTIGKLDLEKVFRFPLTPVPLSLAHVDGSMNRTDKAKLLHKVENMCESVGPDHIDVTIVDAVFLLHTLQSIPPTFGAVAHMLMQILCGMSERIDLVCDSYNTPSIKDTEHARRSSDEAIFSITGSKQKRPKDWQVALRSASFKTSLFRFLLLEWRQDSYAEILHGHQLYLGLDKMCYCFTAADGKVTCEEFPSLHCKHEEADTRMIYHMNDIISDDENKKIRVRSNDTDVFILLVYHVSKIGGRSNVWMDVGLSSNNTRRDINISQLLTQVSPTMAEALPALHAFTGCDYTASFMNKGKLKALDIMVKSNTYSETFAKLGNEAMVPPDVVSVIEAFVCALYGKPKMSQIDDVRYQIFMSKYAPHKYDAPLEKIKGINPSSMPPCKAVLCNKIQRANFVAFLWKRATLAEPSTLKPDDHGWVMHDSSYTIKWFNGDQIPESILQILCVDNPSMNTDDDSSEVPDDEMSNAYSDESDTEDPEWYELA